MELVDLMYRYINKFINSDELLKELKKINLSKYSEKENKIINQLILDVQEIKMTAPNELDEIEENRLANVDNILKLLEEAKASDLKDQKAKKFVNKQYNKLLKAKKSKRDGGKLYSDLFQLMTSNSIVNKYAKKMNDIELLEFITNYISAPLPPEITQTDFNDLVNAGIKEDKREALWRLAVNYDQKNMDFSLIEDYFIEKKDAYYLIELISAVQERLNTDKIARKVIATKDKEFMNDCARRGKDLGLITDEDIIKFKDLY